MVWGSILAGGASLLGGILTNRSSGNRASDQMAFQERLSNTSYQRSMKDMRKAGLNPILAYQQGGASTPGGAMAPVVDAIGKGVSSALAQRKATADIKLLTAQTAATKATTKTTNEIRKHQILKAFWEQKTGANTWATTHKDATIAYEIEKLLGSIPGGLAAGAIGAGGALGLARLFRKGAPIPKGRTMSTRGNKGRTSYKGPIKKRLARSPTRSPKSIKPIKSQAKPFYKGGGPKPGTPEYKRLYNF